MVWRSISAAERSPLAQFSGMAACPSPTAFFKPYVQPFLHWAVDLCHLHGLCLDSHFLWLKVPLLFGLTIGIMALIPFGGTVGIVLTTVLVALQDVWLGLRVHCG